MISILFPMSLFIHELSMKHDLQLHPSDLMFNYDSQDVTRFKCVLHWLQFEFTRGSHNSFQVGGVWIVGINIHQCSILNQKLSTNGNYKKNVSSQFNLDYKTDFHTLALQVSSIILEKWWCWWYDPPPPSKRISLGKFSSNSLLGPQSVESHPISLRFILVP